nr:MAG TPA: hypothetical protein [Caudoviricetes sp.]
MIVIGCHLLTRTIITQHKHNVKNFFEIFLKNLLTKCLKCAIIQLCTAEAQRKEEHA